MIDQYSNSFTVLERKRGEAREKRFNMEMMELSPELNELRNIIISSNLTTCFLILDELALRKDKTYHYERFREEWVETYKNVYKLICKMKS